MSRLFAPAHIGPYTLSHRVVMAPLTRMRSGPGNIPGDLMVEYYRQRASGGGLIISEATPVSLQGYGYAGAPGIYSDSQIAGWKRITDAVHAKGGRIMLQLWGMWAASRTSTCSPMARRRWHPLPSVPRVMPSPRTVKRNFRCRARSNCTRSR